MGKKILMLVGDYAEDYLNKFITNLFKIKLINNYLKYVLNYVLTNLNNPFD